MNSKRNIALTLIVLVWSIATTEAAIGQVVEQRVTASDGREVLLGVLTEEGLRSPPYDAWYPQGVDQYRPDQQVLQQIDLSDYEITVFMGTWCGDSRREVPRLMKILHELDFPSDRLSIVGVDRAREQFKQSPNGEEIGKNIHRVPTVIVSQGGAEVGRIVESPARSLEQDLMAITTGARYDGNYQVVDQLHQLIVSRGPSALVREVDSIARQLQAVAKNSAELRGYGYVHLYQGNLEHAAAAFEINRALFPAEAVVHENLATVYFEQGKHERARESAKRALHLQPDNETARNLLADLEAH